MAMAESDEHADQLARMRAEVDQATSAVQEQARVVAAYFNALLMEGLDVRDVVELTRDWQANVFTRPVDQPESDEA